MTLPWHVDVLEVTLLRFEYPIIPTQKTPLALRGFLIHL